MEKTKFDIMAFSIWSSLFFIAICTAIFCAKKEKIYLYAIGLAVAIFVILFIIALVIVIIESIVASRGENIKYEPHETNAQGTSKFWNWIFFPIAFILKHAKADEFFRKP